MNILVLGGGGRESALIWKIKQSGRVEKIYRTPGNASSEAGVEVGVEAVDLPANNYAAIKDFIIEHKVEMLVVGPEQPLVDGIRDYFMLDANFKDLIIVGPGKNGAKLEGSKDFAKDFMTKYNIPTAAYKSFTAETIEEGKKFLKTLTSPYVLKADGLAAGKGVLIIQDLHTAEKELEEMLCGAKFGNSSKKVVIEEFLSGVEVSVFIVTDGTDYCLLPEAKDYKRIGDGDTGLNTGGMGSVSPVSFFTSELKQKIEDRIIKPSLQGLREEKIPYKGFLFIGLMISNGEPYVIEYNVRMGDPETQSVMKRIDSDIVELFVAMHNHTIREYELKISPQTAVTLVLAAENYPASPKLGDEITISDSILPEVSVFHAGTAINDERIITAGGRVLSLTALGDNLEEARKKVYETEDKIQWRGKYCRKDIGRI